MFSCVICVFVVDKFVDDKWLLIDVMYLLV